MKKAPHGINGSGNGNDALGTALEQVAKAANDSWKDIQALQGKDVPADLSYTIKKQIVDTAKGR